MSYPAKQVDEDPVSGPPVGVSAFLVQGAIGQWSTGLCDCFDDVGNCCLTCWCPCITFGRIAEIVDRGSTSSGALYAVIMYLTGCQWIYSWMYRSKLRAEYNLPESPCCDCCIHFCCEPCALCQQHRELTNRGFGRLRVACQHGTEGRWRSVHPTGHAGGHDSLIDALNF